MSAHPNRELPKEEFIETRNLGPVMLGLLASGGLALTASVVWGFLQPQRFAFSWLYAYTFFFTICAGAFFWVILHHATDSGWSVTVRRQVENLASLFPWLLLLFIPVILLAKPYLYSWMRIPPHDSHLLDAKAGFLNPTFFWIRTAFYFAFFIIASAVLRRLSTRQDRSGDPKLTLTMRKIAVGSLPLFAVSVTFAAIDWLKTLDYTWYSTMWGVYIFAGAAGSSMAVLILVLTVLRGRGYLDHIVTEEHFHIMGKLLLAFTIFWAYIGFSQYMLIWYANIPEETSYFLRRTTASWHTMSLILVIGHFFVPFLFLLRRRIKKTPKVLAVAAVWILLMHLLDIYIIVMPIVSPLGFSPSLLDLLTLVAIGCLLGFFFLRRLGGVSLFPVKDPRIVESINLTN